MRRFLFKDSVRYLPYNYQSEQELENFVVEHYEEIFGENTLFFEKKKLHTPSGIGSIPDGFVIDLEKKKWCIVEVELAAHSVYNHITSQLYKFSVSIKTKPVNREKLRERFYDVIRDSIKMEFKMDIAGITKERHKYVSDVVRTEPEIVVVIDEKTHEVEEACDILPFKTEILEFKTFVREGYGVGDHVHVLESLRDDVKIPLITRTQKESFQKVSDSSSKAIKSPKTREVYTGKKPTALIFQGKRFEVRSWKNILTTICQIMFEAHPERFDFVFEYRGRKRAYFSKDSEILMAPAQIKGTDIFVETNLSAKSIIKHSKTVIALFGYSPDDLTIETRE